MTEKIIYIADDNKEFTDKQECIMYENTKNIILKNISLFTKDKEIIHINTLEQMIDVLFDCNTQYLKINSNNAVKYFLNVMEEHAGYISSFSKIIQKGVYYYNELEEQWRDLEEYIKEKEKEINDLKDFIKNN